MRKIKRFPVRTFSVVGILIILLGVVLFTLPGVRVLADTEAVCNAPTTGIANDPVYLFDATPYGGQTLTTTDGDGLGNFTLLHVETNIRRVGIGGDSSDSLIIKAVDGSHHPTGSVIATATAKSSGVGSLDAGYETFACGTAQGTTPYLWSFASPVVLAANTEYAFYVTWNSGREVQWQYGTDDISGYRLTSANGSTWTAVNTSTFTIKLWEDDADLVPTPTPTPAATNTPTPTATATATTTATPTATATPTPTPTVAPTATATPTPTRTATPIPTPAPQQYFSTFMPTNLYANYGLTYVFTGLNVANTYTWTLEKLNDLGIVNGVIGQVARGPGVPDTSWTFDAWPANTFTAFQVKDNFGRVLSKHYLAPAMVGDFTLDTGYAPEQFKTYVSAKAMPSETNSVETNTVHNILNPNGVTATKSGYLLLHYRTAPAGVIDERIEFRDIRDGVEKGLFDVNALVNYNTGIGWADDNALARRNFVVVSTNSRKFPFINTTQETVAYTSGVTQNPNTLSIIPSAYDYARVLDPTGSPVSVVGESVFIVTESNTPVEWTLKADVNPIQAGGLQTATFTQQDAGVWYAYITQRVFDLQNADEVDIFEGALSSGFLKSYKSPPYNVDIEVVGFPSLIEWSGEPVGMSYGQSAHSYRFVIFDDYTIAPVVTNPTVPGSPKVGLGSVLVGYMEGHNLWTETDHILYAIILVIISWIILGRVLHAGPIWYGVSYTVIIGGLIGLGFFTLGTAIIGGASIMAVLSATFILSKGQTE